MEPPLSPAIQLDANKRCFIDFQGPPFAQDSDRNSIAVHQASAVLTGMLPSEWFTNKTVFIGAEYDGNQDLHQTPFSSARYGHALTPGVEIHANALATLERGRSVRVPHSWLLFVFMLGLLVMTVERNSNLAAAGIITAILVCAYVLGAFLYFDRTSLALPLVPAVAASLLCYVSLAVHRALTEGRLKRWIKNTFQMYVSPEFVNILAKDPDRLVLGGEEKELTILFSDLEGFTSLSEVTASKDLVAMLNEYLDSMTGILLEHGGTLDKYVGDAVMAFWGAPILQGDHAGRAVRAALAMADASARLSGQFERAGRPGIRTRFGLNTGRVIVGNIGSRTRFNYTVIGDEVNLASRLEGANKTYGTNLIVSESTRRLAGDTFRWRELDLVKVKGRETPVRIYEVLSDAFQTGDAFLKAYTPSLADFQARNWQKAMAGFEESLKIRPDDGPSSMYLERCRLYMHDPPPDNWDGVFVMKTK
ncbi:MAG: hypothetical protein C0404_05865 [Verrucomicrobia bacterium]|nr:hypothetical protein [Verrucomicrobiota bacterium]